MSQDDAEQSALEALETLRGQSPEYKIKFVKCFEQILNFRIALANVECQLYEEEILMMGRDLASIKDSPVAYFDNNGPFSVIKSENYYDLIEKREHLRQSLREIENNFLTGTSRTLN